MSLKMPKIIQLDERLSNLIAAGEVVENMASVVKELLENSLDAKSKTIKIYLQDFGLKSIEIIDDGEGIPYDELPMAFKRHATSKIRSQHDLHHIASLGFRGEALPSIASVSKLTIESSTGEKSRKMLYKQGRLIEDTEGSLPQGTRVVVEDLFYNTPARLKHLKSEQRELSLIVDYVNKIALAHANVRFTLTHNKKTILQTTGDNDIRKILLQIYDLEIVKNLVAFENKNDYFSIQGYLCKPAYTRSTRQHITLIANQRIIKNQRLSQAVLEGYRTYLPLQKYPIIYLNVRVDPLLIDVNIHPQKLEIKFTEEQSLLQLIKLTIKETLEGEELIPNIKRSIEKPSSQEKLDLETYPTTNQETRERVQEEKPDFQPKSKQKLPELEYIGQYAGTYLLFQNEEGFYMIDQHAAAERIRYERYAVEMSEKRASEQTLLIPFDLHLSNTEKVAYLDYQDKLKVYGLNTVLDDTSTLKITGIPSWFHPGYEEIYAEHMIREMLREKDFSSKDIIDQLAKDLACKHSIKANKHLNTDEVKQLMNDLNKTINPYTCPHGRPTIIHFSLSEIETMFKRINV